MNPHWIFGYMPPLLAQWFYEFSVYFIQLNIWVGLKVLMDSSWIVGYTVINEQIYFFFSPQLHCLRIFKTLEEELLLHQGKSEWVNAA